MIAHVFGKVAEKFNGSLVIDVHGVGYEVSVATNDFDAVILDQEVKFYTYHHVREQAEELFGFSSLAAKKLFEMLITVQGVGPKAALAILSLGDAEQVRNAIANADSGFVQKATGVGKKTAERLLIELNDRVARLLVGVAGSQGIIRPSSAKLDAEEALVALGYKPGEAAQLIERVGGDDDTDTDTLIRRALQLKFTGKP